jgi:hypothetical protein
MCYILVSYSCCYLTNLWTSKFRPLFTQKYIKTLHRVGVSVSDLSIVDMAGVCDTVLF